MSDTGRTAVITSKHSGQMLLTEAEGPSAPAIDAQELLDRCQQSAELARRLSEKFVANVPGQLEQARELLVARDADRLAKLLHKLRGSLGVFGARTAHALAEQLEGKARAADFDGGEALYAKLATEVERACQELVSFGR